MKPTKQQLEQRVVKAAMRWQPVESLDDLKNTRTCVPMDEHRIYCDMGSNWYRNWLILDLPPIPRSRLASRKGKRRGR